MSTLPNEIRDYLISFTLSCRSAAYFKVTLAGTVLESGGDLQQYAIPLVKTGMPVWNYLFFIDSFFPLGDTPEQLSCVKFKGNVNANVHLFSQDGVGWILLLDASGDEAWRSRLQQKGNEFSLLRQQYTKLIKSVLQQQDVSGHQSSNQSGHQNSNQAPSQAPIPAATEPTMAQATATIGTSSATIHPKTPLSSIPLARTQQSQSSLLLVKICELAHPNPRRSPASTLTLLNAYLSIIAQIVGDEGGMIHHVFGETAVALFGLLPSNKSQAQQAADAAHRMIRKFQDFEQEGTSFQAAGLNIGAAITTGTLTSGMVQSHGYRSLATLGDNVQHTLNLREWIRPGIILIDSDTFRSLGHYQDQFSPSLMISKHDPLAGQQLYAQDLCYATVHP